MGMQQCIFFKCALFIIFITSPLKQNPGPGCPLDWQPFRQSCYLVNGSASATYSDALSACNATGGTLTSVLDQEEHDFLISKSELITNKM